MVNGVLYVIADCSAGFKEDGKAALQRNLLISLMSASRRLEYQQHDIIYIGWNNELFESGQVSPEYDIDLSFNGKLNVALLKDIVAEAGENGRFLLLSDGLFADDDMAYLKEIKELAGQLKSVIAVVSVGADADDGLLADISVPERKCFRAVDILTAFHELCKKSYYNEPNTDSLGGKKVIRNARRSFL